LRSNADFLTIQAVLTGTNMARSSDSIFPLSILKDKTFQAGEIRRVLAFATLYLVITTLLMGLFYHQMLASLVEGVAPLFFVSEDMALVNEAVPSLTSVLVKWIISMMLINLFVTIALGLYITRKLGKPLLAIKRTLREIGDGNLDVRLRSSDNREFGEISGELTAAMRSVREQIAAAKQEINQADEHISHPDPSEVSEVNVDQAVRNCKMALDYFRVEGAEVNQNNAA